MKHKTGCTYFIFYSYLLPERITELDDVLEELYTIISHNKKAVSYIFSFLI